jgi:ParB family chromosome partitioning protein
VGPLYTAVNDRHGERIVEIPLAELHPPEFHPFNVNDDEAMDRLTENIKQYGVREPGLARPRTDGGYELLAGNRRKRSCECAKLPTMPVIIREMDDDYAAIAMVDINLEQRESLLYSEKALGSTLEKLDSLTDEEFAEIGFYIADDDENVMDLEVS